MSKPCPLSNIRFLMKKIIVSLLAFVLAFGASSPSFAGYAQLKPPPGWSQGMGAAVPGVAGTFNFGAAANSHTFKGTTVLTNAALSVAGQYVVVPVSMRIAANAATTAAEYSFGNPLLFAAALAAPFAYAWFNDQKFFVKDGKWMKIEPTLVCSNGMCTEYSFDEVTWGSSSSACAKGMSVIRVNASTDYYSVSYTLTGFVNGSCMVTEHGAPKPPLTTEPYDSPADFGLHSRITPEYTGAKEVIVTKQEFVSTMAPRPITGDIIEDLPAVDWPIQIPVFNPNPAVEPLPLPASPLAPRPLWVPTGNPVPASPATNPQTYTQPGQNVVGAPTNTDPWRVDVTNAPITKTNSTPNTGPVTTPEPTPSTPGEPVDFETCGLPGKPRCLIDEAGTPADKAESYDPAKSEIDTAKDAAKDAIDAAQTIETPSWSFSFQFPAGCAPFNTGLRGVVLDMCQFQPIIHDLMAMVWTAATAFCIIGMVGRTIRES